MKKLLFAALLMFSAWASAATVEYKDDNVTIQLYDTPCTYEKVIAIVGDVKGAKAANVAFKEKVLEACWILDVDHIDIIDETGEGAENVSPSIFKVVQPI